MLLLEVLIRLTGALGNAVSAYNIVMHSHRIFIPLSSHMTDCLQAEVEVF